MIKSEKRLYIWILLIVILLFIISGILFLVKTEQTQFLEWVSYLCMNLAVGTAITGFFYYFGKAREREYQISSIKRELGYLVGNVNMIISGIRHGSHAEKEKLSKMFLDIERVSIDKELLSSLEPKLYDSYRLFEQKYKKLENSINSKYSSHMESSMQSQIESNIGKVNKVIDELQESCYEIADILKIFIGS